LQSDLSACFEPIREIWRQRNWPGVEEGLSFGTPALKVRGKLLVRIREPDVLVILVDFEVKEFLLAAMPDVYFQTDHYKGYPAVLAWISKIDPEELAERIERAWRSHATKKMLADHEGNQS
jgi:hypothetical protein